MKKAYLVHLDGSFREFIKRIDQFDSDDADIFVHVDLSILYFNSKDFRSLFKKSRVVIIPRQFIDIEKDYYFIMERLKIYALGCGEGIYDEMIPIVSSDFEYKTLEELIYKKVN